MQQLTKTLKRVIRNVDMVVQLKIRRFKMSLASKCIIFSLQ